MEECPSCHSPLKEVNHLLNIPLQFCPVCGNELKTSKKSQQLTETTDISGSITFVPDHLPKKESVLFPIGSYQILERIGKGGMGEVFIAYDTVCGRKIALKRIREDLKKHSILHERFLREARITSQLVHPAIIPIYAISPQKELTYYTMPYVQGDTLKDIVKRTKKHLQEGKHPDPIGGSIPALVRIFIQVCHAISYAHSKNILHRDIKPDNIIIGKHGEVLILDWGLAKLITVDEISDESILPHQSPELTQSGKIVGTVDYMAPEKALGYPASYQSDIYSLGVILYLILTLQKPYRRGSIKEFRKIVNKESLKEPHIVAPYRDIPLILSQVTLKCLAHAPDERYQTVDELIHDLEAYIEGRPEWLLIADLDTQQKEDWEFQENVLLPEHLAITGFQEEAEWVLMMISKDSFGENVKIETKLQLGEGNHGIGFLINIPESVERVYLNEGYLLWLGSDKNPGAKLVRNRSEVISSPEIALKRNETYTVRFEKIENTIRVYLNDVLQFSYISYLPMMGTHVGILAKDADFKMEQFRVFVAGQNVMVNCLAVPDAFLAHGNFSHAINEYRRIASAFPGRAEGREALFRSGIALIEQGRFTSDSTQREKMFDEAWIEFEKLHDTPGAPLEYLGKALIHRAQKDLDEEIKCFEFAFRRYPQHPLAHFLKDHLTQRLLDISIYDRKASYNLLLIILRNALDAIDNPTIKKLFISFKKNSESLYFISERKDKIDEKNLKDLSIPVAFWLAKPFILEEIIDDLLSSKNCSQTLIENALYALIELGCLNLARKKIQEIREKINKIDQSTFNTIDWLTSTHSLPLKERIVKLFSGVIKSFTHRDEQALCYLLDHALLLSDLEAIYAIEPFLKEVNLSKHTSLHVDCVMIWAALLENKWEKAGDLLHHYPLSYLTQENTLLFFLYGCWLAATEGKEISDVHFFGILDSAYPKTWMLFSQSCKGNSNWLPNAFLYEKRKFYLQSALYYHCIGYSEKEEKSLEKAKTYYLNLSSIFNPQ